MKQLRSSQDGGLWRTFRTICFVFGVRAGMVEQFPGRPFNFGGQLVLRKVVLLFPGSFFRLDISDPGRPG